MEALDLSLRQRKILYMIRDRGSYITSGALADALKVSSRTVRNDILEMNRALAPYGAEILCTRSKGILFRAEDPGRIRKLSRIDVAFFTRAERIRYLAWQLCLNDKPQELPDLEETLFISRTALMADIRELRRTYSDAAPHIALRLTRNTISFERDELKIRSVLLKLFHEEWDYNAKGNAYFGYHFLDEELLALLSENTPKILFQYGVLMDDPTLVALELTLAIMHYRNRLGHPFPECLPLPETETMAGRATRALFDLVEAHTHCAYPEAERARIYQFISTASFSAPEWHTAGGEAFKIPSVTLETASRYLSSLRENFGVDFSGDADFFHTLALFLRQLLEGNSIFSQFHNSRAIRETLAVEYELAWLFQNYAVGYIGRHLSEIELSNFALCLSGALRNHLAVHPEMKLKAVLLSHRNMAAAWELKRRITEAFHLYLDITRILPVNMKDHIDYSDTDLILATVQKKIVAGPHPETLFLNDMPGADPGVHRARIKLLCLKKIWPIPPGLLEDLFSRGFWHENAEGADRFALIERMAADHIREGVATEEHLSEMLERENLASFAVKSGLVFLHALRPARETRLSILTLKRRVEWNEFKVYTVVMALFREEDRNLLFHLKMRLCYESYDLEQLQKRKTKQELVPLLLSGRDGS